MGFGAGQKILWIVMLAVFVVVTGGVAAIAVRLIAQKRANDRAPLAAEEAVVLSKTEDTSLHADPVGGDITGAHGFHHSSSTAYTVQFRNADGVCRRFRVDAADYNALREGDRGTLIYRGTRFLGFVRR